MSFFILYQTVYFLEWAIKSTILPWLRVGVAYADAIAWAGSITLTANFPRHPLQFVRLCYTQGLSGRNFKIALAVRQE